MIQQSNSQAYMNPDKTIIQKYICTPMSIEALFIIDKAWEQPNIHQQMN